MSRIGKKPVIFPPSVKCTISQEKIIISNEGVEAEFAFPPSLSAEMIENALHISLREDSKKARAMWGTIRSNIANHVKGIQEPFAVTLSVAGVGYRASTEGSALNLSLGYSHSVVVNLPEGITATVNKNDIVLKSNCLQPLTNFSSRLQKIRKRVPYRLKGLYVPGKFVVRKEGKKK